MKKSMNIDINNNNNNNNNNNDPPKEDIEDDIDEIHKATFFKIGLSQ